MKLGFEDIIDVLSLRNQLQFLYEYTDGGLWTYDEYKGLHLEDLHILSCHFEIIGKFHGKSVWAWTCASKLSCTENSSGNLDVNIEFPKALTHYIIIGGIPAFNKINIYGIPFRTDARFETYNSSGYVHLKNSQTLLLKSRHRSETEKIQLFYSEENKSAADASTEDKTQSE